MAYRLKDAEGMATGLRRIVAEQLGDAATQLRSRTDETRDDAIHEARKDLKKARAALRLTRGDLPGDVRRARERNLPRRGAPARARATPASCC